MDLCISINHLKSIMQLHNACRFWAHKPWKEGQNWMMDLHNSISYGAPWIDLWSSLTWLMKLCNSSNWDIWWQIMLFHQCYRFMVQNNWIMEHHETISGLHKSIIKLHNYCRVMELNDSCNLHRSVIQLHQLIMELHKLVVKSFINHKRRSIIDFWILIPQLMNSSMDWCSSTVWMMGLHNSMYEDPHSICGDS